MANNHNKSLILLYSVPNTHRQTRLASSWIYINNIHFFEYIPIGLIVSKIVFIKIDSIFIPSQINPIVQFIQTGRISSCYGKHSYPKHSSTRENTPGQNGRASVKHSHWHSYGIAAFWAAWCKNRPSIPAWFHKTDDWLVNSKDFLIQTFAFDFFCSSLLWLLSCLYRLVHLISVSLIRVNNTVRKFAIDYHEKMVSPVPKLCERAMTASNGGVQRSDDRRNLSLRRKMRTQRSHLKKEWSRKNVATARTNRLIIKATWMFQTASIPNVLKSMKNMKQLMLPTNQMLLLKWPLTMVSCIGDDTLLTHAKLLNRKDGIFDGKCIKLLVSNLPAVDWPSQVPTGFQSILVVTFQSVDTHLKLPLCPKCSFDFFWQ